MAIGGIVFILRYFLDPHGEDGGEEHGHEGGLTAGIA